MVAACTPRAPREPSVTVFAAGTCRQAAPAVITVDRLVHQVRDQHKKPTAIAAAMTTAQRQLRAVPLGSDPTVDALLHNLIVDIGVLRISVDTGNYQPARLDRVARSQQAVVNHCAHPSAKPGG